MINGWGLGSSEERAGVHRRVMIVRGGEMVYASDGIFLISRIPYSISIRKKFVANKLFPSKSLREVRPPAAILVTVVTCN